MSQLISEKLASKGHLKENENQTQALECRALNFVDLCSAYKSDP